MNLLRSLTRFFKINSKNNTFLTILLSLAFLVLGIIGIVNHGPEIAKTLLANSAQDLQRIPGL